MFYKRIPYVIFFTILIFIACDTKKSERVSETDVKPVDTNRTKIETVKEIEDEKPNAKNVKEKIAESIINASNTYNELGEFREKLFNDGLEQIISILCSGYRIMKLNEIGVNNDIFNSKITTILDKQILIYSWKELLEMYPMKL